MEVIIFKAFQEKKKKKKSGVIIFPHLNKFCKNFKIFFFSEENVI